LYLLGTALASAICLLLLLVLDKGGFASSLSSMACALSIGMLIRNFNHREKMLHYLERSQDNQFSELENYLEAKQSLWENNLWIRLIVGVVTGLVMILLILFNADPYWSITIASLFIILILAIAILGWINFNDRLLLHDIRRSHRDQPSNEPE
jgi:uncharacterized membrane protein YfcA